MVERRNLPRQALPNARLRHDGRPMGSKCGPTCRPPTSSQAHCSVCHQTMRAVGDFDDHRFDGWCLELAALGLAEVDRLWATPEGHRANEMNLAKLAKAQSQRPPGSVEPRTPPVGTSTKGGGVDHV